MYYPSPQTKSIHSPYTYIYIRDSCTHQQTKEISQCVCVKGMPNLNGLNKIYISNANGLVTIHKLFFM